VTAPIATEHYVDEEIAVQMVIRVAEVLKLKGLDVVRTKVEKVVFDSRNAQLTPERD
jgi:hypothetical protein